MRHTFHTAWIASGLALAVAACGQNGSDAPVAELDGPVSEHRAYFETLFSAPYSGPVQAASEPVDFEVAFANLPDGVSLETGTVSVVAGTGATKVEDFALVYDVDGEGVGLQADEVLFYGFDPNAMTERMRGNNLSETVKVADRIELRGVNSVGMDVVSRMMMDSYIEALDELTPIDGDMVYDGDVLEAFTYNFGVEALVIDGFTLQPFEYNKAERTMPPPEEGSLDEIVMDDVDLDTREGFQIAAAFARAFSIDAVAYKNLSADYSMQMDGVSMSMDLIMPLAGLRGYQRGDLEYSGGWDASFTGAFPLPTDPYSEEDMTSLPMSGGVALTEHSGIRLARAFEALANWEMPAAEEADFFDLGTINMRDYTIDVGGKSLFKVDSFAFDSDFHWLLPTKIDLSFTDAGYNIANLFDVMAEELSADMGSEFSAEDLQRALAITKDYGFDCFCGDFALTLAWDETSGDMTYRERSQFAEAFTGSTDVDLGFSTPAKVASLFEFDDPEEAFETAFKSDFAFRGLTVEMSDIGGLTNLFDMLHAIGQAFPEQDEMAMLTYNDAAQLRMLAVNAVISVRPMVRQEFEPADGWMTSLATFLEEGGTLTVAMRPPEPITVALVESMDEAGFDPEPEEIVEFLGLTVTHTK